MRILIPGALCLVVGGLALVGVFAYPDKREVYLLAAAVAFGCLSVAHSVGRLADGRRADR